jgi:hypothetical protein
MWRCPLTKKKEEWTYEPTMITDYLIEIHAFTKRCACTSWDLG